jgi:hypothetical protein
LRRRTAVRRRPGIEQQMGDEFRVIRAVQRGQGQRGPE